MDAGASVPASLIRFTVISRCLQPGVSNMTNPKKIYFYGRAGEPVAEKLRVVVLPESLKPKADLINEALSHLDTKGYMSSAYLQRLVFHLRVELGVDSDLAHDLIAKRFGYAHYSGLKRSRKPDEEFHKQRAKRPSIQAQVNGDMRSGAAKGRDRREEQKQEEFAHHKLLVGTLGSSTSSEKYKAYFFHKNTSHLEIIEGVLASYTDCYLQAAAEAYPRRMENDLYYKSFGLFWRKILRLQETGKADFAEPGLRLVKQLCHHLFTWNFRRYLADVVIARYAPYLPVQYRHLHVAAKLDTSSQVVIDVAYPEMDFIEEPDDNIGNC